MSESQNRDAQVSSAGPEISGKEYVYVELGPEKAIQPILKGRKILATEYYEQSTPGWEGNPLIEALLPQLDHQQVIMKMRDRLKHDETHRTLDVRTRLNLLHNTRRLVQPVPIFARVQQAISTALRWGYVDRNPFDPHYAQTVREPLTSAQFREMDLPDLPRGADILFVHGDPGTGKSTAVERSLLLEPQVILHEYYNDRVFTRIQLTWLKIDCSPNGSLKQTLILISRAVDALCGTSYTKLYNIEGKGRSAEEIALDIITIIRLVNLGMLIIDEIQNLHQAHSGGASVVLNTFVGQANGFGVPVVFVGTESAVSLFQREFRLARRADRIEGGVSFMRFRFNRIWELFLQRLWEFQYTTEKTELSLELSMALFNVSQGIPDIACKVYMLVQARAITNRKQDAAETITRDLIYSVAMDRMKLTRPVLDALRKGRTTGKVVTLMGDLILEEKNVQAALDEAKAAEETLESLRLFATLGASVTPAMEVKGALSRLAGVSEDIALTAIARALGALGPTATTQDLLPVATAEAEKLVAESPNRKGKRAIRPNEAGLVLVEVVLEGRAKGLDGHAALSAAGWVKEPFAAAGLAGPSRQGEVQRDIA